MTAPRTDRPSVSDLPGWLARRIALVPALVPLVVGIGVERNWWAMGGAEASLWGGLGLGLAGVVLGRRLNAAEAELELRRGLDDLNAAAAAQYDSDAKAWERAELEQLAASAQAEVPEARTRPITVRPTNPEG